MQAFKEPILEEHFSVSCSLASELVELDMAGLGLPAPSPCCACHRRPAVSSTFSAGESPNAYWRPSDAQLCWRANICNPVAVRRRMAAQ